MNVLIRRYLPNFYFHSRENYFSCDMNRYINCTSMWGNNPLFRKVESENIKHGVRSEFQIASNLVVKRDENSNIVTDIIYAVFFPYNGNIGIVNKGEHWVDIEHVTLRFKHTPRRLIELNGVEPNFIYFSHHSNGTWKRYDDTIINDNGKINVYIAKHSHAFYWKPKTFYRYCGFANDKCDTGRKVSNDHINLAVYDIKAILPLFKYMQFHQSETNNFKDKQWLYNGETDPYNFDKNKTCFN